MDVHEATTRITATDLVAEYNLDIQSGASGPRFSLPGSLTHPRARRSAVGPNPRVRVSSGFPTHSEGVTVLETRPTFVRRPSGGLSIA
jgi:hypothetical protein